MKILFWNIRGAAKSSATNHLSSLMREHKIDVVVLLETRLDDKSMHSVPHMFRRGWFSKCIPSVGLSGGIIALWRKSLSQVDFVASSSQLISGVISEGNDVPWIVGGVYAKCSAHGRRDLWKASEDLLQLDCPVLLAGDFNCITSAEEKVGGAGFVTDQGIREFRRFISTNNLSDLGFSGPGVTWCNNQDPPSRVLKRLDRALANEKWLELFPETTVKVLPRIASDHSPLLLDLCGSSIAKRKPWRFEDFWLQLPASQGVVDRAWRRCVRGNIFRQLSCKIRRTKEALKGWNKDSVENLFAKSSQLQSEIAALQSKEALGGGLSMREVYHLRTVVQQYYTNLKLQETLWRQKARMAWIKGGDQNSAFFTRSLSAGGVKIVSPRLLILGGRLWTRRTVLNRSSQIISRRDGGRMIRFPILDFQGFV